MRNICTIILVCLVCPVLIGGCTELITKNEIIGSWEGTYSNDIVGTGIIQIVFFEDSSGVKAKWDLQRGEISGTSLVSIDGNEISFIGMGTKLRSIKATFSSPNKRLTGTLIIDYEISGTKHSSLVLDKV